MINEMGTGCGTKNVVGLLVTNTDSLNFKAVNTVRALSPSGRGCPHGCEGGEICERPLFAIERNSLALIVSALSWLKL
jgi:hypothetical protein